MQATFLHEIESGKCIPCRLARMTLNDIASARFSWEKEFQWRRDRGAHDDDAPLWASGFMAGAASSGDCDLKGHVITAGGDVQGIVVIDKRLRPSRTHGPATLAYVRYLATAPWNRRCDEYPGRYRGVGQLLVVQAIVEGMAVGCLGRVGLHSFVAASPFYERLGFTKLGADPAERGMLYFELLPDAAHALLIGYR